MGDTVVDGIYIDPDYELMCQGNEEFLNSQPNQYKIEIAGSTDTFLERHVKLIKETFLGNLKPNQPEVLSIKFPQAQKYNYREMFYDLKNLVFGKAFTICYGSNLLDTYILSELLLAPTEAVNYYKKKLRSQVLNNLSQYEWKSVYQAAKILEDKELLTWCLENKTQAPKSLDLYPSLNIVSEMSNDGLLSEAEVFGLSTTHDENSELYHDKVIALASKVKGLKEISWSVTLQEDKQTLSKIGSFLASQPNLTKLTLRLGGTLDQSTLKEDFKSFGKALGGLTSLTFLHFKPTNPFFVDEEMANVFAEAISKLQKVEEVYYNNEGCNTRGKLLARALKGFSALPLLQIFELKMDSYDADSTNTEEDFFEIADSLSGLIHLKDAKLHLWSWRFEEKGLEKILEAVSKWTELEKLLINGHTTILSEDFGITLVGKALSKLSKLTNFTLAVEHYAGLITNKGLTALAEALPKTLVNIDFNFSGNEGITDEGFIALLTGFSKLTNCKTININIDKSVLTDNGYSKLSLLSTLKDMDRLSFTFPRLGDDVADRDEEWKALLKDVTWNLSIRHSY